MHPLVARSHQFSPYSRDRHRAPEHTDTVETNSGLTSHQVLGLSPPRKHISGKSPLTVNDYPATSGCTLLKIKHFFNLESWVTTVLWIFWSKLLSFCADYRFIRQKATYTFLIYLHCFIYSTFGVPKVEKFEFRYSNFEFWCDSPDSGLRAVSSKFCHLKKNSGYSL